MKTLNTILVAVDFSTGSRAALDQAIRIANLQGASLHIVHVVEEAAVAALAHSHASAYESQAKISSEGAATALDRWLEGSPVPRGCVIHIVIGHPLHEILEQVRVRKADLLVAGIAGAGNGSPGAGSVSGKLARKAPCRVLLVRADHPKAFAKIVACIDFSETCREVIAAARRVAMKDGASVDFVHVWQDPLVALPYVVPYAEAAIPMVTAPEQREGYVQYLHNELHGFVSDAAHGIQSSEVLLEAGNLGDGIAQHARECKAELIVVGNKGRTNLRYMLLGSTAERLLHQVPCSLLVVKPALE